MILDTFGCCSGVLRNDSMTHSEQLMEDLEKKIATIAIKISSYEVAVICVAAVDEFERQAANLLSVSRASGDGGRTPTVSPMKKSTPTPGNTPPFLGRGPVSAHERIASLNVGSSNRWFNFAFSVPFHRDLVSLLERCGCSASHYGVMIEAEVRSRLLSAYESLLKINAGLSVHTKTLSAPSNHSNGLGSAGSLMRYGEWRSEAFRWTGRLHRLQESSSISGDGRITVGPTQKNINVDNATAVPPPAGMSIEIINLSPTSSTSRKMFGDRPVLRKGFSFAEMNSGAAEGDQSKIDIVSETPVSDGNGGVTRNSYVLPNATATHRVTATHGPINCSPHCTQNGSQETNDGSFLAVTPVLPFGIFRSMHSIDPAGEHKTNVAVNFRASILRGFVVSDLAVVSEESLLPIPVILDNCLCIKRDVDTNIVTKRNDSFGAMFSNTQDSSLNYSAMLASTALSSNAEGTIDISWIPMSVMDNTWEPEANVMWDFLSFICSPPLFSDPFNLPIFSKAMLTLGLGSGTGLYHYLSCLAIFTNRLPVAVLINSYYNKPSVSVLFFRYEDATT